MHWHCWPLNSFTHSSSLTFSRFFFHVLTVPPQSPSSVHLLMGIPGCWWLKKNLFTKSVTLFTKEIVHLSYSSSDSALDLSSLWRRFLLWSLSWVLLTGIFITSSVIAFVTWNSQCLLIELCYCTKSYLKTHLHLFSSVSPHLVQCLSHSRHSIPLTEWIKEFRGITQLYILVSK